VRKVVERRWRKREREKSEKENGERERGEKENGERERERERRERKWRERERKVVCTGPLFWIQGEIGSHRLTRSSQGPQKRPSGAHDMQQVKERKRERMQKDLKMYVRECVCVCVYPRERQRGNIGKESFLSERECMREGRRKRERERDTKGDLERKRD